MERDKLVKVFDNNAIAYDKYRPSYPNEAVEELIELSQIGTNDKLLEIGCGTGQITIDFLKRGYEVIAIEKGASLSKIAKSKVEKYGKGQIINASFEAWMPNEKFKLMISAQAFHWIDKEKGIDKTLGLLEGNGAIGLIWNVDESQETEFWRQTSRVYEKYLPLKQKRKSMEGVIREYWDYMNNRKGLKNVEIRNYKWQQRYAKDDYLGLLSTFSPQMSIEAGMRKKFFKEIESIIENNGNQVLRYYKTVLLFARKRD